MQKQVNETRGLGPILVHCHLFYEERKLSDWFTHIIPAEKLLEDGKRQKRIKREKPERQNQQ